MIEEEAVTDFRAGMNVDPGQEAGEVVDQAGKEEQPPFPQPMADAMEPKCQHTRVEQDIPPRAGGRITRFDGVEICDQAGLQADKPFQIERLI
jgi:hypothetical protein